MINSIWKFDSERSDKNIIMQDLTPFLQLNQRGTDALPSYQIIKNKGKVEKETIVSKVKEHRIDAVLVVRNIGEKGKYSRSIDMEKFRRGGIKEEYYSTLPDYYNNIHGQLELSLSLDNERIITVGTNMYDANSENIIWSATTETVVDGPVKEIIKSSVKMLLEDLYDEKFFK